jgi:hypothetical protein
LASIVRLQITNIYGGDYTAVLQFGANKTPLNVLLDTGSSTLAVDASKYKPDTAGGDQTTDMAQFASYGDGSYFTGALIHTTVTIGAPGADAALAGANVAVAYSASSDMFGETDGILGLAYAELDDAFTMPQDTWAHQYTEQEVRGGQRATVKPYLTQLAGLGVVSDKIAFYTRRSFPHEGGGASDPLNLGWIVVGGGEESTDLYVGEFQVVTVKADKWWNTNLKSVIVGGKAPLAVRSQAIMGQASNSIVDSGTNSLNLGPRLLRSIMNELTHAQAAQLENSIKGQVVNNSDLDLATWPTISFVLEGDAGDVTVDVAPGDYWQLDTGTVGQAQAAITQGTNGLAILGLPAMNGYFVIFDGEADNGRGVIRFAKRKG